MYKGILVGLGSRGNHWMGQARQHPRCELVAYVEASEKNQKAAIDRHGLDPKQVFGSLEDAVAATKADFVIDVTPPAVHAHVAEVAFNAGLHVLGEKPLSDDYATAIRVAEMGEKAGLKHMITQNYRFVPQVRTLSKVIGDGMIGAVGQCDVQFYMPWADMPGSHYVTQPYMLINDMMVHHFDLLRCILGQDPVAVQAITWNQPWGWHAGDACHAIVFEYESGLRATHVAIGCSVGDHRDFNGDWRLEGPKGSLNWSAGRITHTHLHRAEKKVRAEVFPEKAPANELNIFAEFFSAIEENRAPECSARDNLASVGMVFAAIKSAKEGRRVELAELG